MSNLSVREELEKATGLKIDTREDIGDYTQRLCDEVAKLNDDVWNKFSIPAQDFFNSVCDAANEDKPMPPFPEPAAAPAARTRRGTAAAAAPAAESGNVPQAGDIVVVTTKRGKVYEGEFITLDGDAAIVLVGEEEMEFTADRVESLIVKKEGAGGGDDAVVVGASVTLTTKRHAVIKGIIVEISDELVVLNVDGAEAEYSMERVESIVVDGASAPAAAKEPAVGDWVKGVTKRNKEVEGKVVEIEGTVLILNTNGRKDGEQELDMATAQSYEVVPDAKPAASAAAPARTRRGTAAAAAPAASEKTKATRSVNKGISIGLRIKEILCAEPDMTQDQLEKQLKKEKLEFNTNTMLIGFKDFQAIIKLLKENKHFK